MSIEVSCQDCEMSYRLPDRYAGKRCRCRECGTRIRVPGEAEGKLKKGRAKARAVGRTAQRTTRRLNSQEQDILNDRRVLRTSEHIEDGISESLHQLSPMTLSGTLDLESSLPSAPPSRPARARKRTKSSKGKGPVGPSKARHKAKGKRSEGKEVEGKKAKAKTKSKDKKAKTKSKDKDKANTAKPKAKKSKDKKAKAKTKTATPKAEAKSARATKPGKRAALRGKGLDTLGRRPRTRGRVTDEETEGKKTGRDPVHMAAIIAGTLCLLVGLVLGMAIQGIDWGPSPESEARETLKSKMAFVDGSIGNGKWDVATTELRALEELLEGLELPEERDMVGTTLADVSALAAAAALSDPYERLDAIKPYATHNSARIRRGVVTLLRPLAAETDEVDLLTHMCKDPDSDVAAIAQQGLIAVGGPSAIPYLHEAVKTSTSGSKLGDVALERALEIDAPEIVPTLVLALEVRKSAPAPVLRAILEHLYQIGEPSCVEAAQRFTSHDDASVREAAEKIVADLGE